MKALMELVLIWLSKMYLLAGDSLENEMFLLIAKGMVHTTFFVLIFKISLFWWLTETIVAKSSLVFSTETTSYRYFMI